MSAMRILLALALASLVAAPLASAAGEPDVELTSIVVKVGATTETFGGGKTDHEFLRDWHSNVYGPLRNVQFSGINPDGTVHPLTKYTGCMLDKLEMHDHVATLAINCTGAERVVIAPLP